MQGKIVRLSGNTAKVNISGEVVSAVAYQNTKATNMYVGDNVVLLKDDVLGYVITEVLPRENMLIRPNVTNVDVAVILISTVPEPDLFVLDRILVNCEQNELETIIVINKNDIVGKDFIDDIKAQYKDAVDDIIITSCVDKTGIAKLKKAILGKTAVFVGQSAVGKSTIINLLGVSDYIKTNELALKVGKKKERGKNTTRGATLYSLDGQTFLADTPGFESMSLLEIRVNELIYYYRDLRDYLKNCKYGVSCTHMNETEECGILEALQAGKVNKDRYTRFIRLQNQLKRMWEKKYGK